MKKIFLAVFLLTASGFAYGENVMIRLEFNGETADVEMFDNRAARDFISRLTLTLKFQDYVGKEKIAHLQEKLETDGDTGRMGDFAYYAP